MKTDPRQTRLYRACTEALRPDPQPDPRRHWLYHAIMAALRPCRPAGRKARRP